MKVRQSLVITGSAAALMVWGLAGAQTAGQAAGQSGGTPPQYPATQGPSAPGAPTATESPASTDASSTANQKISNKEKHWSGTLVDVSCMAKELQAGNNASTQQPTTAAPAGVPHFANEAGEPSPDGGQQRSGGGMAPGEGSPSTTQTPGSTATAPTSGMSPADQAQMAKAERIDSAAKQCPPTSATQLFGLSMSGGQVVQFDRDGDSKAAEALKTVSVQPGKKVKAKVTGVMATVNTVKVASVEVKGKRSQQGGGATSSGSGL
jgi:hypothetical protein